MQILARGHVSCHACVDMLNVIDTFLALLTGKSVRYGAIILWCDPLFCGIFQLFAKTSYIWANVTYCECVGVLSLHLRK